MCVSIWDQQDREDVLLKTIDMLVDKYADEKIKRVKVDREKQQLMLDFKSGDVVQRLAYLQNKYDDMGDEGVQR